MFTPLTLAGRSSSALLATLLLGFFLSACDGSPHRPATTATSQPATPAPDPTPPPPPTPPNYILAVGKSGGSGRIVSTPEGIDCGPQCSHSYAGGSQVQLRAEAESGYRFLGWSGDCSAADCTLKMDANHNVSALFEALVPVVAKVCDALTGPALAALKPLRGSLHMHSSYSDNPYPSEPRDYYTAVKAAGLDFGGSAEHSENTNLPITASEKCIDPAVIANCIDPTNLDLLRKWDATLEQARAATTADYTAFRGFEWSSDRFGHINVFFSKNITNDKTDGGYALTMDTFYAWLARSPDLLGGSDSLTTFNHPGDKKLQDGDSAFNWNHFAYVPAADKQMVGIELYNGGPGPNTNYPGYYIEALSQGWHVGAIGAEDKHNLDWGQDYLGKTVLLATGNSEAEIKAALSARRSYALKGHEIGEKDLRIQFDAEDHPMGSRLRCDAGKTLPLHVSVRYADGSEFNGGLSLIGAEGRIYDSARGDHLDSALPVPAAGAAERWFFVRVENKDGVPLAYTSPVWIKPRN